MSFSHMGVVPSSQRTVALNPGPRLFCFLVSVTPTFPRLSPQTQGVSAFIQPDFM